MSDACKICGGAEWVCENHVDRPWDGMSDRDDACGCGAGAPCRLCNLEMASAGYVEREREKIRALLDAMATKRDYVSDVVAGHLVYPATAADIRPMAREDLKRIEAAISRARVIQ